MSSRFAFMIFLIFMVGCKSDGPAPLFTGTEAVEYEKILADFEGPKYKWGFLTEDGKLAVEDKYDDLREFSDGLAAYYKDGLWGFLNTSGHTTIPARFRRVKTFTEGIAVTEDLNGRFHLLNKNGDIIADSLELDDASKFEEGKSVVSRGMQYGFMDKTGKMVIEPVYEYAKSFSNGLAMVKQADKYGFIDHNNTIVIPLEYDKIWSPESGMIRFRKNGTYGFIDLETKKVVHNGFASATDFQGERAIVNDGNNYQLITKKGIKSPLPYSYVDHGGEGKWIYAADSRFGFLNNDGTVLCLPQYDLLMRYREGRAGYSIDDVWGYLDESGEVIIPAMYPLVWDFVNGYARIIRRYGFGFIDRNGNEVLEPRYMEVRDFSEGLARIQVYR